MATPVPVQGPTEDRPIEQHAATVQERAPLEFQRLERVREKLAVRRRRLLLIIKVVVALVAIGALIVIVVRQTSLGRRGVFRPQARAATPTPVSGRASAGAPVATVVEAAVDPPAGVSGTTPSASTVERADTQDPISAPAPVATPPPRIPPTARAESAASPRSVAASRRAVGPKREGPTNAQRPSQTDRHGGAATPAPGEQQNDRAVPTAAIDWLLKSSGTGANSTFEAVLPGERSYRDDRR